MKTTSSPFSGKPIKLATRQVHCLYFNLHFAKVKVQLGNVSNQVALEKAGYRQIAWSCDRHKTYRYVYVKP